MSSDDKKNISSVGSVFSAKKTDEIKKTENVENISKVHETSSVGRVSGTDTVSGRKATRIMTLAERHQIFQMINEEADKIFPNSSDEKKRMLTDAVKMAIDSSLIDEDSPKK